MKRLLVIAVFCSLLFMGCQKKPESTEGLEGQESPAAVMVGNDSFLYGQEEWQAFLRGSMAGEPGEINIVVWHNWKDEEDFSENGMKGLWKAFAGGGLTVKRLEYDGTKYRINFMGNSSAEEKGLWTSFAEGGLTLKKLEYDGTEQQVNLPASEAAEEFPYMTELEYSTAWGEKKGYFLVENQGLSYDALLRSVYSSNSRNHEAFIEIFSIWK